VYDQNEKRVCMNATSKSYKFCSKRGFQHLAKHLALIDQKLEPKRAEILELRYRLLPSSQLDRCVSFKKMMEHQHDFPLKLP